MTGVLVEFGDLAPVLAWIAIGFVLTMLAAVIAERVAYGLQQTRTRRISDQYRPLIRRAIEGDDAARQALAASPARHRVAIAWLIIEPLVENRDSVRIERAREIALAIGVPRLADQYLESRRWWRRALALRALGLIHATDRKAQLVAALDDTHPDVRAAAMDALMDLRDPATVPAVVIRVNDESLHRGRRGAALKALGTRCEPFLLEVSNVDPQNRLNYIHALAICGTSQSRPVLCRWTRDTRLEVRAAAFQALGWVGLDEESARVAVDGLDSAEPQVRAMAAYALHGWRGPGDAPANLARHLDDEWPVAVQAARTLRLMGPAGAAELQARAAHSDLAGLLSKQMLWQPVGQS